MTIAGDAQILQVATVSAKFVNVVIADTRPVLDKLELLHFLNERAVAVIVQRISKLKTALAVSREAGHALSGGIIRDIQAHGARVFGKISCCQRIDKDPL